MKSKLFTLLFTFLVINSVTFALGAGIQIDSIPVLNFDLQKEADAPSKEFGCVLTGTFKMERIPLTVSLGLKAGILNGKSSYGLSANADYSFINAQIINNFSFISGAGLNGALIFNTKGNVFYGAGTKFFAGVSCTLYDGYLELYLQQCACPKLLWKAGCKDAASFLLEFPTEAGLRFHF